jgi:hypothetical protein
MAVGRNLLAPDCPRGVRVFPLAGSSILCECGVCCWQPQGLLPVSKGNSLWKVVWLRCPPQEGMVCLAASPIMVPLRFSIGGQSSTRVRVAR